MIVIWVILALVLGFVVGALLTIRQLHVIIARMTDGQLATLADRVEEAKTSA